MKILEELWYGNVAPSSFDTSACKDALELACHNEEKRKASLTDMTPYLAQQLFWFEISPVQ